MVRVEIKREIVISEKREIKVPEKAKVEPLGIGKNLMAERKRSLYPEGPVRRFY